MTQTRSFCESDLAKQLAFGYYLRTGHLLRTEVFLEEIQRKFNQNHDPQNGRFTFGPGGVGSGGSTSPMGVKPNAHSSSYPVRVDLTGRKPLKYPVRIDLPVSRPPQPKIKPPSLGGGRPQPLAVRFTHSPRIDLPEEVIAKANVLADSVHLATGHQIHVTSGRRPPGRQALAMYNNYLTPKPPVYVNKAAEAEVHAIFQRGRARGMEKRVIVGAMTLVLEEQTKRGIYLSSHMRSNAIDIRTPPASVLQAIRRHPAVQKANAEDDHIHIQFR